MAVNLHPDRPLPALSRAPDTLPPLFPHIVYHVTPDRCAGPFYSLRARIGHAWMVRVRTGHGSVLLNPDGMRVTDDFGDSVRVENAPLLAFLRQCHDDPHDAV
jgi:hypothetical protein